MIPVDPSPGPAAAAAADAAGRAGPFARRAAVWLRGDGAWRLALLALVALLGAHYLSIGWGARGNNDNDSAYYLGVARHIARTGRFEEPIVWHFLTWPASVRHAPFDYWQGLTSLLLVPPMWLFGWSDRVAFTAMAGLSTVSLLLFWWLIAVATPIRRRSVQLAALLAFALSPAMAGFRFDTESVVPVQVLLLAALGALARGRRGLAMVAAFLMILARSDSVFPCCMIWLAALWSARRVPDRVGSWRRLAVVPAALVTLWIAANLVIYRFPIPPGAARAPRLQDYGDLFRAPPVPSASFNTMMDRWSWTALLERAWAAFDTLRTTPFLAESRFWLPAMLIVGALVLARGSPWQLIWALLFGSAVLVSWSSPVVFAGWRTLHPLLPLLVLAAASVAEWFLDGVASVTAALAARRRRLALAIRWALTCLVLAPLLHGLGPYSSRSAGLSPLQAALAAVDARLGGGTVAMGQPWDGIAMTRSPTVSIPINGEPALTAVVDRYRAEWLILQGGCSGDTEGYCRRVLAGEISTLGPHRLEPLPDTAPLHVYRIRRR